MKRPGRVRAGMLGAGVVAVLAAGAQVSAVEPRSAIPWLSQSIEAVEPPPARSAAGNGSGGGSANKITVTPLGDVSRDAVGLLAPEATGLPRDLWGPASAVRVRGLILGHTRGGVPEARALFQRLLLAEADPPPGSGPSSSVLVARVDRLLEIGALREAEALIDLAGPETPDLFRRWFDIGVLRDRAKAPCEALRQNPQLSPTLPARVFCLARGGDWNAAEITLTLGKGVGAIPPEQERLLARFLDPDLFEDEPAPPTPVPLTALDFLMREAVGLPRPAGSLPLAFLHQDLNEHAPMRTRISAAERLVLAGAIDGSVLFEAYRAGEPAASGGVWDRALAVQELDAALAAARTPDVDTSAVAAALSSADAQLSARGLRLALAQEFSDQLSDLAPGTLPETVRGTLFELLLLGGAPEAARVAMGTDPTPRSVALLTIAGAGTAPERLEGDLMAAGVKGLAQRPPVDEREMRLAEMTAAGRRGEAILAALELLSAGNSIDPAALQAALFTLAQAGHEESARRIALQTLLLGSGV